MDYGGNRPDLDELFEGLDTFSDLDAEDLKFLRRAFEGDPESEKSRNEGKTGPSKKSSKKKEKPKQTDKGELTSIDHLIKANFSKINNFSELEGLEYFALINRKENAENQIVGDIYIIQSRSVQYEKDHAIVYCGAISYVFTYKGHKVTNITETFRRYRKSKEKFCEIIARLDSAFTRQGSQKTVYSPNECYKIKNMKEFLGKYEKCIF